jgi:cobalt-zinc-cadmium efflux system membrane fusion protein
MQTTQTVWMKGFGAVALAIVLAACSGEHAGEHGAAEHGEVKVAKGPNGGRMLEDGDFAIELAIFERGVPPEFRAWAYQGGEPLPPAEVQLEVELRRFANRTDRIGFAPAGAFLRGDATVEEPHSFEATVRAMHGGREHRFAYSSYEGRVTVDAAAAKEAGIAIEVAGPAQIAETLLLYGRIESDGDRTAHVTPRFPGIVVEARKRLGDAVAKDEVVAVVESNESLRPYEVRSRIAGTVIEKTPRRRVRTTEARSTSFRPRSRVGDQCINAMPTAARRAARGSLGDGARPPKRESTSCHRSAPSTRSRLLHEW